MNAPPKIEAVSLIGALAKALPELESAKKNKANPAFKSRYADIAAVIEAIEPITHHGLWFRQVAIEHADGACFETFYIHEGGEELSAGVTFVPASKKDAQGYGSAQTYARRYGLLSAFGLATEDDDGNAAAKAAPQKASVVDDAQWAELVQLIEVSGADVQAFCTAYKIDSLRALPAEAFSRAKAQLNKKLAQRVKEDEPA